MLVWFLVILFSGFFNNNAYGVCSVDVTTTGDIDIGLAAGLAGVTNDVVNINTDCSDGYDLYIGGPEDAKLYQGGDDTSGNYVDISSGTIGAPALLSTNTYGYSLDPNTTVTSNTFVGITNIQTLIATKDSPSVPTGDDINIYYGAKVAGDKPVGTYTMADNMGVTYYVIGKDPTIVTTVTFDANGGSIPAGQDWSGSGDTATKNYEYEPGITEYGAIPTPIRNGYTFLGWSSYTTQIPSEYQKVEYIESDGSQYILTNIFPNDTMGVHMVASTNETTSSLDKAFFGSAAGSSTSSISGRFYVYNSAGKAVFGWNGYTPSSKRPTITQDATDVYKLNYMNSRKNVFNNIEVEEITESLNPINNRRLAIFGINEGNVVNKSSCRIYEFVVTENDNITHNLVPSYRKNDGAIGLYDVVDGIFYTNDGTGSLKKGLDSDQYITSLTLVNNSEDHTLYAVWGRNPTITFDANGGTVDTTTKNEIYGSLYGQLPTPTRNGYTFLGWSLYNLPSEYQAVEYIRSTGTQYVMTDVVPDDTTGVYLKLSTDDNNGDLLYIGSKGSGDSRYYVSNYEGKVLFGWNGNIDIDKRPAIADGFVKTFELNFRNSRKKIFDNVVVDNVTQKLSSSNNYPLALFGGNWNGTVNYKSKIDLYELVITHDDKVVRSYVPCYRKSDGEVGLYDVVSGVFYTNDGTNSFIRGDDIYYNSNPYSVNYIDAATTVTTEEDHMLYAMWGHNPTVTFDANGGTVAVPTKTYDFGADYLDLPVPLRNGYRFMGWKTTDDDYVLPNEYQEVEYTESTGTQYIITDINVDNNNGAYLEFASTNTSADSLYFGSKGSNDNRFWAGNISNKMYFGWNTSTTSSNRPAINVNQKYELFMNYLNDRKAIFNNLVIHNNLATLANNTVKMAVFAGNYSSGGANYKAKIKLYNLKISDGTNIVNNLVPCYRVLDEVVGLYDVYDNVFYTNQGSGEFKRGDRVVNIFVDSSIQMVTDYDHTLYAMWELE